MNDLDFTPIGGALPENIEAEEAILGGILLDPEAMSRVCDILQPEAFHITAHQKIYRACLKLYGENNPTDLLAVTSYLTDHNILQSIGGRNKLATLIDRTVSAVNIDSQAELVTEKYRRRTAISMAHDMAKLAYDTEVSLSDIANKASELQEIIEGGDKQNTGLTHIAETLVISYQEIETRATGVSMPGLSCGFYDLDAMTSGFQKSDLIIVAARPSIGKTAFALNVGHYAAASSGKPVGIFSLEMSKQQLVQRLLSSESGIESSLLQTGRISQHQWEDLAAAVEELSNISLYLDDSANITVSYVRSQCLKLKKEKGDLGAVIIDYLQLMGGSSEDDVRELSRITRGLKQLARELDVPIIALSQLNRGVEARTNKRPMLSDLRQSGSIEQDADIVMMLYRDEYYNPDTPDRGIAEVIVAKHRNGPTGTIKLLFDPQYTKFRNLARVDY